MRALPLVLLLALVVPLSGCTEVSGGLSRLAGGDAPDVPLPYYREYQDEVVGEISRAYAVPVEDGAQRVVATLRLQMHDAGTGLGDASTARLDVRLLDPAGAVVDEAVVDPAHPNATLALDAPTAGEHRVVIEGVGASQTLDDVRYGAAYVLAVEVAYA